MPVSSMGQRPSAAASGAKVTRREGRFARRMLRHALSILVLVWISAGCGDDVVVFFRTSLGTIDSDATCTGNGGEFPLRQQQGLVVLIVLDADSAIVLANGTAGTCHDLTAGNRASVRGQEEHGRFLASEVYILGG
jgi:hypothetical protein